MSANALTWEQAVLWLREQPDKQKLVLECYYDDPLLVSSCRYAASDEWQAVRTWLPPQAGTVLDIGAGRGISSFALAQAGWHVTALEPDPSDLVGAGAIRSLAAASSLPITVVEEYGEALPFCANSFDLVYGRQVLHHARDLAMLCQEAARVLKPGGRLIAAREHVIDGPADLALFLDRHPLHKLYGGENAFELSEYCGAIEKSGLHLVKKLGPYESPMNYAPLDTAEWRTQCIGYAGRLVGRRIARTLLDSCYPWANSALRALSATLSYTSHTPGRLYSFIADKRKESE